MLLFILMIFWPWLTLCAGKGAQTFFCYLLVHLGLHINFFQVWTLPHAASVFRVAVDMSVSLPSDKLIKIQQLVHALFLRQPLTVHPVCPLWARTAFLPMEMHNFASFAVIQSDILHAYHSLTKFISSFSPLFSSTALASEAVSIAWEPGPLWFWLPDVVITTDTIPHH